MTPNFQKEVSRIGWLARISSYLGPQVIRIFAAGHPLPPFPACSNSDAPPTNKFWFNTFYLKQSSGRSTEGQLIRALGIGLDMSDQATRSDEPARWLVEEHDDGVHQVTRYVRVFDTPVQRVYGFIQRARFLLGSLQLLFAFNKDLLIQAPWCFCAIALSKAAMALQGAAKVYVTGTLMRQTQQYLQGNREEYEMLPVLSAVLLVGMVPGLVRKFTLWPRGRIAMLVNISIDERLMAGFSKLNEEDREREQIKDMVNEASKLYIREHGGGGPMRGLLGAEEVFGLASKQYPAFSSGFSILI